VFSEQVRRSDGHDLVLKSNKDHSPWGAVVASWGPVGPWAVVRRIAWTVVRRIAWTVLHYMARLALALLLNDHSIDSWLLRGSSIIV